MSRACLLIIAAWMAFAAPVAAARTYDLTRAEVRALVLKVAAEERVEPVLFDAVIRAESNYDIHAVSHKGAMGLAQLMPGTAVEMGLEIDGAFEPEANLRAGARYLRRQIDAAGDVAIGLAAYNAGMGRVKNRPSSDWPRETQNYVLKIMARVKATSASIRIVGSIGGPPPTRSGDAS